MNAAKKQPTRAQIHAHQLNKKINLLAPKIEKAAQNYIKVYREYNSIRETLRVYAARGIISREDVPKPARDYFHKNGVI